MSNFDRFSQPISGEAEEAGVVAICDECNGEIFRGECALQMANGDVVHDECFVSYAKKELDVSTFIPKDEVNG
ncbi:hypothetical protein D3C76_613260 [compost metagenome]